MKNLLMISSFLLLATLAQADEGTRINRLGEDLDECPKGCECITDTAREKNDKSAIIRVDDTVPEPKEGDTISK